MTDSARCPHCFETIDPRATRCSHCTTRMGAATTLARNAPGRIAGGVCAALAQRFSVDPIFVRVVMLLSMGALGPLTLWLYALLWVLTPFEVNGKAPAVKLVDWVQSAFAPTVARPAEQVVSGLERVKSDDPL